MRLISTFCFLAMAVVTAEAWGAVPTVPPPSSASGGMIQMGRNPDEIAETDEIVTQIIPLHTLAAQDLLATLARIPSSSPSAPRW
jgi:hypothetical protein